MKKLFLGMLALVSCVSPQKPMPEAGIVQSTSNKQPQSPAKAMSTEDIARIGFGSSVLIVVQINDETSISQGSGFFISPNVLATNFHVVKNAKAIIAKKIGSKEVYVVKRVLGNDEVNDLSLLEVDHNSQTQLSLGNSDSLIVGQKVFAIGNPEGLEGTFSDGLLSSIRGENGSKLLQITAPISPGSSGGPIMDNQGRVIGVAVAFMKEGQSLNFAVPVNNLTDLLRGKSVTGVAFSIGNAQTAAQSIVAPTTAKKLKIGMTKNEVISILGPPKSINSHCRMPHVGFTGTRDLVIFYEGSMCNDSEFRDDEYNITCLPVNENYLPRRQCAIGFDENEVVYIENFNFNYTEDLQ